jgi:phenylacetate-CoA ligase
MPLIRYQVGDIATPKSGMCSCGRSFGLIKSIQGRDTDVIFTPDGNRLIVHFFTGILEHFSEIDSFQVVQKDINSILLLIVLRDNSDPTIQQRVINALKQKGTGKLKINIQIVDEIPLTKGGKRRFVISNLSQNND